MDRVGLRGAGINAAFTANQTRHGASWVTRSRTVNGHETTIVLSTIRIKGEDAVAV